MSAQLETRARVASVARLLSRAGLIQAFGHVSARLEHGGFALTSTEPLIDAHADSVLELDEAGHVLAGERCPLEAPLHAALYAARADVGAICRTHSPNVAAWACRGEQPPLVHGLGGLSGTLAVHDSPQLICDQAAGAAAAAALAAADCLLLRANGALCTAPDLSHAVVRAWFLEERATLARRAGGAPPLSDQELRERARHFGAEAERAWSWLQARFGDHQELISPNYTTRRTG
jgi:ribulose-5-phosphate 4-epimerase/fuculose-1-phosphate aldolase